jgi:uncharacterized RDD family membrane protein YckC
MWKLKLLMRRLAGMLYDSFLLAAVLFLATALMLPLNGGEAFQAQQWWYHIYLVAVVFLFIGWFWTHGGQTLGMKVWRLRLQTVDEGPIGWGRAAARFVSAFLSLACFGLGYLWIVVDPQGLAWHDRVSGTRMRLEARDRAASRDGVSSGVD